MRGLVWMKGEGAEYAEALAPLLAARRGDIAGRVRFFFQPGEEGHGGARIGLRPPVAGAR